jgi:hypothetical protein
MGVTVSKKKAVDQRDLSTGGNRTLLFTLTFLFANILLSAYYLDIWPTPNPVSRVLPVLTFAENKTLQIDRYKEETIDKSRVGEHYYSDKAPLPTLLLIPMYELMKWSHLDHVSDKTGKNFPVYVWRPNGVEDGRDLMFPAIIPALLAGSFLIGSLPFAGVVILSYLAVKKSDISPVLLVMFSFYGSFLFVYSGTFFSHVFAGFLLLIGYLKLKDQKFLLSGLFVGLSFLSEYTVFIAVPVWLGLILLNRKRWICALQFALGFAPSAVGIMIYNWKIAGNPFTALNAYHAHESYRQLSRFYGLSLPSWDAVWGLSFSGAMGVFIFAPLLLIAAYLLLKRLFTEKGAFGMIQKDYLLWFGILFFFAIASFFTWWGGWSYGPRYLTALVVLLIYEGLLSISKQAVNRFLFFIVTGYGLISAWFAKSTLVYMVPDRFLRNDEFANTLTAILLPELRAGRYNSNNVLSALLNVSPEVSSFIWISLFFCVTFGFAAWHRAEFAPAKKKKRSLEKSGKSGRNLERNLEKSGHPR